MPNKTIFIAELILYFCCRTILTHEKQGVYMSFLKKTVIGGLFILLTSSAVSANEYRCDWLGG